MKITFLGHAALAIDTGNHNLIVDPFITGNDAADISVDSLQADFILVTHAHLDHVLDVEKIARRTNAKIISNYEIATHYQQEGFEAHPMGHGGSWDFDFGRLKFVNAIHTSSFQDGSYGGQPGGFVLTCGEKVVYIAGDTALTKDMELISMHHNLNLAILPIGDNFTMGYEDAAIASDFLKCDQVLGYHYDTFGLIEIDKDAAKDHFTKKGKTLILLEIGESIEI